MVVFARDIVSLAFLESKRDSVRVVNPDAEIIPGSELRLAVHTPLANSIRMCPHGAVESFCSERRVK
jgi:hypothetical protein